MSPVVRPSALRKVGTAFALKGGGRRNIPYTGISISGECLSLPQKKKARGEEAAEPEAEDAGDDFLE